MKIDTRVLIRTPESFKETHFGHDAERLFGKVGLARKGGKQAILKRADHRFIERFEFVSHNGRTSFPWAQLRAFREYHERAERCKSFSKNITGKFLRMRMPRPVHVELGFGENNGLPRELLRHVAVASPNLKLSTG